MTCFLPVVRLKPDTTVAAALAMCVAIGLTAAAQAPRQPSISRDDLRTWLTYIASDELQGRLVYSEGLGLAGAYIADHLKEWGVKPGGDRGSYFQEVRVLGVRTRSNSSVTVTVNGQSRTFKDGEGVTFPRNQGAKQTVSGEAAFAGYGVTFAPLQQDDYAQRPVSGKVAIFLGRTGPKGFTTAHNRILNARGRVAIDSQHAVATITQTAPPPQVPPSNVPAAQRVDFQTAQRLDARIPPQITASDDFFNFLFSASSTEYSTLRTATDKQEPLPTVALSGVSITINVDATYDVIQTRLTRNVVGLIEGSDSSLRDTYVLLGAHYDHIGYEQFAVSDRRNAIASCAGQTRPTPRPGDIINNGADDDGSGTVTLMALAKAFSRGPRMKRSLLLVWHTSEEGGLSGSRFMADHPIVPLERVSAQLNIDMVGRNRCDDPKEANTVYIVGADRISTELHNVNEESNDALPSPLALSYELNDPSDLESIYTRSDHYSYASKGVPIIFFTTGLHPDYHYVTDEVDKIEFPKMARIAALVYGTATRVANLDHQPRRDNLGPRIGKGQSGRIETPTRSSADRSSGPSSPGPRDR
jgi:peptidase M28-like protein